MYKIYKNYPHWVIIILYAIFIYGITFILLEYFGKSPEYFHSDDGYLNIGKNFIEGKSGLSKKYLGPVLPIVFSWITLFPVKYYMYLKLFITLTFTLGNLFLLNKIFNYFELSDNKTVKFFALTFAVFNPLYIHWTLNSSPDIYVLFFIILIISIFIKYHLTKKQYLLLLPLPLFVVATFLKPVFILIPFILTIYYLLKRRKTKFIIYYLIFLCVFSFGAQISFNKFTKPESRTTYGTSALLKTNFLLEAFNKTHTFNWGTRIQETNPEKSNVVFVRKKYKKWLENYLKNNEDSTQTQIIFQFIKDHPKEFILTKLINPFLFFFLASNTPETLFYLVFHFVLVLLFILKIKKDLRIDKKYHNLYGILVSILIGYSIIFWLSFSYARYSLPVIFIIIPFAFTYFIELFTEKRLLDNII
jgi:hypothetical protein